MCFSLLSGTSHQQQANPIKLQGQSPRSRTPGPESSSVGPSRTQHKGNRDPSVMTSYFFSTPAAPIILQKASSPGTST